MQKETKNEVSNADSKQSATHIPRRSALKMGVGAASALGMSVPARGMRIAPSFVTPGDSATNNDAHENESEAEVVDSPEGFSIEVLAPHTNFPDDVAVKFKINYYKGAMGTVVSELPHISNIVIAKATWEPEGTTGWHTHPGPVIVTITEGELELVNELDCIPRTYTAGEAFVAPGQGNVHIATNPSATERTVAYATFLGVPDGAPATVFVEPVDCEGGEVEETDDEDDIYEGPGDDDDGDDTDNDGDGYVDEDDEDRDDDGDSDGNNRDDDGDGAIDEDGDRNG